jgi:zinc transporter ZupT
VDSPDWVLLFAGLLFAGYLIFGLVTGVMPRWLNITARKDDDHHTFWKWAALNALIALLALGLLLARVLEAP